MASRDLIDCVGKYLAEELHASNIKENVSVSDSMPWRPTVSGREGRHFRIAVQVEDESVYPTILRYKTNEILECQDLISVYSACPVELVLDSEGERLTQELASHGFGLLLVDQNGGVQRRIKTIPLIQHIPRTNIRDAISGLPRSIRRRVVASQDTYESDANSGLGSLTELGEEVLRSSARRMERKGWLDSGKAEIPLAQLVDAIGKSNSIPNTIKKHAPRWRDFIDRRRNPSHHPASTKQDVKRKYKRVKEGFIEGVDLIADYHAAVKQERISFSVS